MYFKLRLSKPFGKLALINGALLFMVNSMIVNGGNYVYNLGLGRILSPAAFAEAGLVVTLLLIASFLAMTFQIVTTKFGSTYEGAQQVAFTRWIKSVSLKLGLGLGLTIILFADTISGFFQLTDAWIIRIFGLAMPLFFTMSVKRGLKQGKEQFLALSGSYQAEMWIRLFVTFAFIFMMRNSSGLLISGAVVLSVLAGDLVLGRLPGGLFEKKFSESKTVWKFFFLTAAYECAQVIINYGDVLLVKHFFSSEEAGFYTSMSLIGRMIYFLTWMMVMVLIPRIINLKKKGKPFQKLFFNYLLMIAAFSGGLVSVSFLFPETIVITLFGSSYLPMAGLLWMYTLATMLFALSNLFVYYFLSLDNYIPVFVAIGVGLLQLVLLATLGNSLHNMIFIQIVDMFVLFVLMVGFFVRTRP